MIELRIENQWTLIYKNLISSEHEVLNEKNDNVLSAIESFISNGRN